jgi:hypothetical protein
MEIKTAISTSHQFTKIGQEAVFTSFTSICRSTTLVICHGSEERLRETLSSSTSPR